MIKKILSNTFKHLNLKYNTDIFKDITVNNITLTFIIDDGLFEADVLLHGIYIVKKPNNLSDIYKPLYTLDEKRDSIWNNPGTKITVHDFLGIEISESNDKHKQIKKYIYEFLNNKFIMHNNLSLHNILNSLFKNDLVDVKKINLNYSFFNSDINHILEYNNVEHEINSTCDNIDMSKNNNYINVEDIKAFERNKKIKSTYNKYDNIEMYNDLINTINIIMGIHNDLNFNNK